METSQQRLAAIAASIVAGYAAEGVHLGFQENMTTVPEATEIVIEALEGRHGDEAVLIRNMHVFEEMGRDQLVLDIEGRSDRRIRERIEHWLEEPLGILREDRDLRLTGGDPLSPRYEELEASQLLREMILWADVHTGAIRLDRTSEGGLVHTQGGRNQGTLRMAPIRLGTGDQEIVIGTDLRRRRIYARDVITRRGGTLRIRDEPTGTTSVAVAAPGMPDTVLAAAVGRPLRDLVRHPFIMDAGTQTIRSAEHVAPQGRDAHVLIHVDSNPRRLMGGHPS